MEGEGLLVPLCAGSSAGLFRHSGAGHKPVRRQLLGGQSCLSPCDHLPGHGGAHRALGASTHGSSCNPRPDEEPSAPPAVRARAKAAHSKHCLGCSTTERRTGIAAPCYVLLFTPKAKELQNFT